MASTPTPALDEPHEEAPAEASSPDEAYRVRCARFSAERDALTERWSRIANQRLLVFLGAAGSLVLGAVVGSLLLALLAPVLLAVFIVLAVRHGIVGRMRARAVELLRINEEARKRLARDWDTLPLRHRTRAALNHPYAADLDIFGRASLFHLLETVRTSLGESTLAVWLEQPAAADIVSGRQQAVAELAGMVDLRDELQLRGTGIGDARPDPEPFLKWAEGERWLAGQGSLVWSARLSPLLALLFLILQVAEVVEVPVWIVFILANVALWRLVGSRSHAILNQVASQEGPFLEYAALLQVLAEAPFRSPALRRLQDELTVGGVAAPEQMRRLHRLAALSIPSSAMLYAIMQLTTLWDVHVLALLEGWQKVSGRYVRRWLVALGEAEALAALARLAHDNPAWAFPEVEAGAPSLQARGLGHPLLPEDARVVNDLEVGPRGSFLLVTGSNMSGKSTLLRAIGVNAVLAGAGGPVCATALRLPPVTLWTCMRVQDSLERGVSYFMAELERLKAVVDAAREERRYGDRTFLYLLDEVLQGTNTAERQIAARRIIAHLVSQGAIGAVSTHDLSLAEAEPLTSAARPVHFTETITRGLSGPTMTFDYLLHPGIATSTNALKLMEIVGLDLREG